MPHRVEGTDEFADWYGGLTVEDQRRIERAVGYLEEFGYLLGRPHADTVNGSRHPNMKELRPQGSPIRVFFAFDPRRTAILLLGGEKSGDNKFYARMVPRADDLYDQYLIETADEV